MGITKLPAAPSDASSSESDHDETSHADSSDSDSHSDALDSHAARKRRKVSPPEDDAPRISIVSAPSRISKAKQLNDAIATLAPPNPRITAALDHQTTFADLDVKPWLVGSLNIMAIKRPTGIQKGCIPEILKGRDCIGGSRTGSGKTVAFAVPILQKWAEDPFGIFAVVLTPTRYEDFWGR